MPYFLLTFRDVDAKRLALLHELVPKAVRNESAGRLVDTAAAGLRRLH